MGGKEDRFLASRGLVEFLSKYSRVIGKQLVGVREMIESAVAEVMTGINEISQATGVEATQATKILEETYFNPDNKTKELVDNIQSSVDRLLEQARADLSNSPANDDLLEAHLRRFGGQFSKHMEALSTLDQEVSQLLLKMMGALSNDDVIRQKLEHVVSCIQALQVGLSYVLIDFNRRFTLHEVESLKKDLLIYTYDLYTSEEEKLNYNQIFGEPMEKDPPAKNRFAS